MTKTKMNKLNKGAKEEAEEEASALYMGRKSKEDH